MANCASGEKLLQEQEATTARILVASCQEKYY